MQTHNRVAYFWFRFFWEKLLVPKYIELRMNANFYLSKLFLGDILVSINCILFFIFINVDYTFFLVLWIIISFLFLSQNHLQIYFFFLILLYWDSFDALKMSFLNKIYLVCYVNVFLINILSFAIWFFLHCLWQAT